jgi:hypothetical protein
MTVSRGQAVPDVFPEGRKRCPSTPPPEPWPAFPINVRPTDHLDAGARQFLQLVSRFQTGPAVDGTEKQPLHVVSRPDCVPSLGPGEEQRKVDEGARRQPGGIGTIRTGVDGPAEEERRDGIANPDPPNRSGVHVMKIGGRGGDQLHLGKGLLPRFPQRTIPNRLTGLLASAHPSDPPRGPLQRLWNAVRVQGRSKHRPFARITPAQKGWFRVREAMSISVSSTGIIS